LNLLSQDIAAGTASVATLDRKGAATLQSPPLPSRFGNARALGNATEKP